MFLALAIVLTGVGAAMSLFMRIVPNPGDGLVQGISDFFGLKTGLSKNIVDISCVIMTLILSLLILHRVVGVGIGTLVAMLGIGRVVALFEMYCGDYLKNIAQDEK